MWYIALVALIVAVLVADFWLGVFIGRAISAGDHLE